MSNWSDLLFEDEDEEVQPEYRQSDQHVPVGYQTRIFLERGADIGNQRNEAVRATRNLLGAGFDAEVVAAKIFGALNKSPQDPGAPWVWDEVWKMVADVASKPAPPLPPFEEGTLIIDTGKKYERAAGPGVVVEEETASGTYVFAFPDHNAAIEVSRVTVTAKGTVGWIRVLSDGEELCAAECEFRTAQGVLMLWRFFEGFGAKPWKAMLELARRKVLHARRTGGVLVRMSEVVVSDRAKLRVSPFILNGHLNVIFATGGSGKSLLMVLLSSLIHEGRSVAGLTVEPGNVLYLDWEEGAEDSKETLTALGKGIGGVGDYRYMKATGTLVEIAEEVGQIIVDEDIAVVMIDSLTFALGGDKNDAQTMTAGKNAMRAWRDGTTIVALDHQAKQQGGKKVEDPFGTVFVRNSARNMLQIDAYMDAEAHVLHQVIQQKKTNKGALPTVGLRYVFEPESLSPERILVEREDPPFDVAARLKLDAAEGKEDGLKGSVLEWLRTNNDDFYTIKQMAQGTGHSQDRVREAIRALRDEEKVLEVVGKGSIPSRYGTRS